MNPNTLKEIIYIGASVVATPLITLLTIWFKDRNKLKENDQAHQFEQENKLIKVLQDDIAELKNNIKELNTRLDGKDTEIRDLQNKLNLREIDYGTLIRDHAILNENHQKLQLEHNGLKKQYDDTVKKLDELTKAHDLLQKKSSEAALHMVLPTDKVVTTIPK